MPESSIHAVVVQNVSALSTRSLPRRKPRERTICRFTKVFVQINCGKNKIERNRRRVTEMIGMRVTVAALHEPRQCKINYRRGRCFGEIDFMMRRSLFDFSRDS